MWGVIASRSGSRETTALKLPLVPRTQPRSSKRRPARHSADSVSDTITGATGGTLATITIMPPRNARVPQPVPPPHFAPVR